jgi:tetratricopeptide (TPR) repeat protein
MQRLLIAGLLAGLGAACSSPPPSAAATQQAAASTATITMTSKSPESVAHLQKGEALLDNLRIVEASLELTEALKLDPNFALAHDYHGQTTAGPEGLKEMETAADAAKNLPEGERSLIEGDLAVRRGENAAARRSFMRLIEVAPAYWRGHFALGTVLLNQEQYADAVQALKKATELNADAGAAQNQLGYAALRQGDTDGAIAALTQYARLLPQEPNPQDSLGEALTAAGRFKEAEAAFQKALELSPQFWNAHEGIAYARFYAGDWKGGREALAKAKAAASRRTDKLSVDDEMAGVAMAQRNTAEALKILDAEEKTEGAQLSDVAFVPVRRAQLLIIAGRGADALAPIAVALKNADSGQLPPAFTRNLRREALKARVMAEARAGDKAAAEKTSAELDQAAATRAEDIAAQTAMHFGKGQLAMASGDAATARTHFDQCSVQDQLCMWQAVIAAEKAGDKPGAASARERFLKVYLRDPTHLVVRSQLVPGRAT